MDGFVDIHNHVLPQIDDGAGSLEESLAMLEIAAEEGITDMIVTPHYKEGRRNASIKTIQERLRMVQEAADEREIPVTLYSGTEIYSFEEMGEALEEGRILTMNGSDRALIEFSPTDSYTYIRNALDSIRGLDYIPIIAHAERYECFLKHWEYVEELKHMDAEIQVNVSGVTGGHGFGVKRFIHQLLKRQLVDYVATDAHDSRRRAPVVRKCLAQLHRKYDAEYVEAITYGNAFERMIKKNSDVI